MLLLKQQQLIELKKKRGLEDFKFFFEEVLEYTEKLDWDAHGDLISDLQEIKKQIERGVGSEKLLLEPRGFGKTTVFTISGITWLLTSFPNLRILLTNSKLANAEKMLDEIKRNFLKQSFKDLYGDYEGQIWRVGEIRVRPCTRSGKEQSVVVGSPTTSLVSQHFDVIFADDLVDSENCTTKDQLDKVKQFFSSRRRHTR